jgi:hypothetical protein
MQHDDTGRDGGYPLVAWPGVAQAATVAEVGRQAADEARLGRREPVGDSARCRHK